MEPTGKIDIKSQVYRAAVSDINLKYKSVEAFAVVQSLQAEEIRIAE